MHITFEDKVVVITGAVGGLGSAMCRRFGADGARVIVCDLRGTAEAVAETYVKMLTELKD